jgi:hypothetical protein
MPNPLHNADMLAAEQSYARIQGAARLLEIAHFQVVRQIEPLLSEAADLLDGTAGFEVGNIARNIRDRESIALGKALHRLSSAIRNGEV